MTVSASRTVSIVGIGKLGSPIAACFASKGHRVIGLDVNPDTVDLINKAVAPVFEPGLDALLKANKERLSATMDWDRAIAESSITFLIVPTPSEEDGGFSLRHVLASCEHIGTALRSKKEYHLVVLVSTVLPGATEGQVRPALEKYSGKYCGQGFGLCYSPEFIALGSVIRDVLNPDMVLIGESDPRAGAELEAFYTTIPDNAARVVRTTIVNAELAKIALNTYVTTKITFANTLARICEKIPGAHVDEVTTILGMDTRIGPKYLKGAISYGGPCFPRDNIAFSTFARNLDIPATLALATDAENRSQIIRIADLVKSHLPPSGTVGVLGLAYKPNTNVTEESSSLLIAERLTKLGVRVIAYDPAVTTGSAKSFSGIELCRSMEDCVRSSEVLVVATPWDEFKALPIESLRRPARKVVVIDCWRLLDPTALRAVADYIPLGVGEPQGR